VAIVSVDVAKRSATGRTNRGAMIPISTNYHVGACQVTPSVGDQWQVVCIRGEWRLTSRLPHHTADLLVKPEQGQTQIGAAGPTELHGSVVNVKAPYLTLNGTPYRDRDGALQRQEDDGTWTPITPNIAAVTVNQITNATALGKALLTASDVNEVLTILGLAIAGAGLDGGTATSPNTDPIVSGGTVSGPRVGADLDGGSPSVSGDIVASGGTP
jgi:nitrous oxidase accessory protein NosD